MRLRSYYAVAAYNDSKTKFSFAEGAVIQVLKKDASGEWPTADHVPVCVLTLSDNLSVSCVSMGL